MAEPHLQISDGQGRRTVKLNRDLFLIGRRGTADLPLNSADVSREHAEIVRDGDQYRLRDRGSRYGTFVNVPEGAESFTTIELKSNFVGTKRGGAIGCEAKLAHGGRATQVWDATVSDEEGGKPIALFRCTQMILYPR